jgi:hypothetical protein
VTRTAVTIEQLSKNVSADMNTRDNRRAMLSVRSAPRIYKKDKKKIVLSQLSFDKLACQNMSLGAEKLS